jgi:hypothetical protein
VFDSNQSLRPRSFFRFLEMLTVLPGHLEKSPMQIQVVLLDAATK